MRSSAARRASMFFQEFLVYRNYSGDLLISHEKRTLVIDVKTSKESDKSGVATLSGGEKSYTTVSLLLALWQTNYSPFRAMDEFDVFMDAVNRKSSMDLLANTGKHNREGQFIYITPNDLSETLNYELTHTIKMYPPNRN